MMVHSPFRLTEVIKFPGEEGLFWVVDAPYVHLKLWPLQMVDNQIATLEVAEWKMQEGV